MKWTKTLFRKEPALTVGALVGVLTAITDALADQPDVTTWTAALPLIVGGIARQFVVSPSTAQQRVESAFADGIEQGKAKAKKAVTKKPVKKAK